MQPTVQMLEAISVRLPYAQRVIELRDHILHQVSKAAELRQESLLSLFAVARTELEEEDIAFVGKTYSLQAGVAWERPEGFRGEAFDLPLHNMVEPVVFDILAHPRKNIEITTEWHKRLQYQPLNPELQLVEFAFQSIAAGHCSLVVDFYHERRWLRTIRFEFDSVEIPQPVTVST
jgi:hypothetical protein